MNIDQRNHFEGLILRNFYNELTPEEQIELHSALNNYPEVRAMNARMEQLAIEKKLPPKRDPQSILKEYEAFERKTVASKQYRINWMVAASIIVLTLVSITYYYVGRTNKSSFTEPMLDYVLLKRGNDSINLEQQYALGVGSTTIHIIKDTVLFKQDSHYQYDTTWNELVVPPTREFKVILADGSKIHINSKSSIKFHSAFLDNRTVYLDGEAYFDVAQNAAAPFTVIYPTGKVLVLGTTFNLNAYDVNHTVTSLVSGKVALIADSGDRQQLQPGQSAAYRNGNWEIKLSDTTTSTSWREGIIYFENTPLKAIAPVIERWYNLSVKLDSNCEDVLITSRLRKSRPLSEFLDMMSTTANLKVDEQKAVIKISKLKTQ